MSMCVIESAYLQYHYEFRHCVHVCNRVQLIYSITVNLDTVSMCVIELAYLQYHCELRHCVHVCNRVSLSTVSL